MPEITPSRYVVSAGWDDAPHLDETTKRELLASTPPHLRDARSKGIPSLGLGAVYPVPLEHVTQPPMHIPPWWPRAYGFDVGWKTTAAVWVARDPETLTYHAYAEYYGHEALPVVHAAAITVRGKWLRGAIDPASRGRSQADGAQLFAQYQAAGLNLVPAVNAVESGVREVWQMLETGRLRLSSSLHQLMAEYRLYRRGEGGKIVKSHDHGLDALRYAIMTFDKVARVKPVAERLHHAPAIADTLAGY